MVVGCVSTLATPSALEADRMGRGRRSGRQCLTRGWAGHRPESAANICLSLCLAAVSAEWSQVDLDPDLVISTFRARASPSRWRYLSGLL